MGVYKFTFLDEMHLQPIKEYVLDCDIDKTELEDVVALLNATKWRRIVDLNFASKNIRRLNRCQLIKEKKIILGGYSGGPLGRRMYTYPVIYEKPVDLEVPNIEGKVECKQEGSHLLCSLDPKIL